MSHLISNPKVDDMLDLSNLLLMELDNWVFEFLTTFRAEFRVEQLDSLAS